MALSIIVAMSENGVIGRDGDLPWRISEDLKRFKKITMGKPIIMGRKTWESIGRPLPGRPHIVISRDAHFRAEGVDVVQSFEAALARAMELTAADSEIMVIGGAEIYRLAMERADRMYVTEVEGDVQGDTYFPEFDRTAWQETAREGPFLVGASQAHTVHYSFVILEKA